MSAVGNIIKTLFTKGRQIEKVAPEVEALFKSGWKVGGDVADAASKSRIGGLMNWARTPVTTTNPLLKAPARATKFAVRHPYMVGVPALGLAATKVGLPWGSTETENQLSLADLPTGTGAAEQAAYDLINRNAAKLSELATQAGGAGDMGGAARASLNAYLQNMNKYVAAQSPAIKKAYEDLAANAAAQASQAYATGQGTAAAIDKLYQDAGLMAAGYGAGEGLSAAPSEVSGLTGAAGTMATAPDTTRAYGATLADYLGRAGNITRDDLMAAAQSYAAQGVGAQAELQNQAALLGAQRQYELGTKLAEYEAQRNAALQDRLMQIEADRQGRLFDIEAAKIEAGRAGALEAMKAPQTWKSLSANAKKQLFNDDFATFKKWVTENPGYVQNLLTIE